MSPKKSSTLKVYIDGASSGNPGPSGIGVIVTDESGKVLQKSSHYIGETTNNRAEYLALLFALQTLHSLLHSPPTKIIVHTDSELLYNQLVGRYRVRHPELRKLWEKVIQEIKHLPIEFRRIPRSLNRAADRLAKKAIKGGQRHETIHSGGPLGKGSEQI